MVALEYRNIEYLSALPTTSEEGRQYLQDILREFSFTHPLSDEVLGKICLIRKRAIKKW